MREVLYHWWRVAQGAMLAGLMAGCATSSSGPAEVGDTSFLSYEGKQQDWPTEPNALVEREWAVPVYRGLPPKPYAVAGRVIGTQNNVIARGLAEGLWSDRDRLRNVCAQARLHGADAVMLTENPKLMDALHVLTGEEGAKERPLYNFSGAVVAIRWLANPQP